MTEKELLETCTSIYVGCGIRQDSASIVRDVKMIASGLAERFPNISDARIREVASSAVCGDFGEVHNFTPNMFFSWLKELKERRAVVTNQQLQIPTEEPKLLNAHKWTAEDSVEECRKYLTTDAEILPFCAPPFVEEAWQYLVDTGRLNAEKLALYEKEGHERSLQMLPTDNAVRIVLKGGKITLGDIEAKKLHLRAFFNHQKK